MTLSIMQRTKPTRIVVRGPLDGEAGAELLERTRAAVRASSEVVIDVGRSDQWTPEGLAALLACADLGAGVATDRVNERFAGPHAHGSKSPSNSSAPLRTRP